MKRYPTFIEAALWTAGTVAFVGLVFGLFLPKLVSVQNDYVVVSGLVGLLCFSIFLAGMANVFYTTYITPPKS